MVRIAMRIFTCIAMLFAAAAIAVAQEAPSGQAVAVAGGIRVVWQQPQPQPYYYLIYRKPAGRGFPKRINPDYAAVTARWTDAGARHGNYRYRVCAVYSPDGTGLNCSAWFTAVR
jgi:hypothetical protein